MADEPFTGTPRRTITLREIIERLERLSAEEAQSARIFHSTRGELNSEALDAARNFILGVLDERQQANRFKGGHRR